MAFFYCKPSLFIVYVSGDFGMKIKMSQQKKKITLNLNLDDITDTLEMLERSMNLFLPASTLLIVISAG